MTKRILLSLLFLLLFLNLFINPEIKACKDVIACGDATEGNYNLLMKVRDPTKDTPQLLCIIPEGYEYTYHHPWTGDPMFFKNEHKYVGIVSKGQEIPNIVKAGMSLSDVGISYGDADTNSKWKNPSEYAWDDFDWIRYACEKADNEDEAISLMTKDVVKKLHATGISENLFIVGPKKGVVIEADAFHYRVKEIENGVVVMNNYPIELWKSQIKKKLPIAWSFDTVVEKYVKNNGVIRLKSIRGVKVVEIGNDYVYVKPVGFMHTTYTKTKGLIFKINLGERKNVGHYSVELKDINAEKAKLRVCYKDKAWEEQILEHIKPKYGHITVKDMIKWARLHREDLDGLRPLCEDIDKYEAVAIYKIPKQNYDKMSMGWFSPNHACSSIFVPFHISNTDFYEPYKTGDAAEICLNLLNNYGHKVLNNSFVKTEEVFLNEMNFLETITKFLTNNENLSGFLTLIDMGMQKQAFITEQIWIDINEIDNLYERQCVINIIDEIWNKNYSSTLVNMKNAIYKLEELETLPSITKKICDIALDISNTRLKAAKSIGKQNKIIEEEYTKAADLINQQKYDSGFIYLQKVLSNSNKLINGQKIKNSDKIETKKEIKFDIFLYFFIVLFVISITIILYTSYKIFKK